MSAPPPQPPPEPSVDPAASPFARLPLLADGDPAGALRRSRPDWRGPVEALNQDAPEGVAAEHAAQARAGADLLRTNTAHANAAALLPHGLADRAEALNNSGSALARQGQQIAARQGQQIAARQGQQIAARPGQPPATGVGGAGANPEGGPAAVPAAAADETPARAPGFVMGTLSAPPRAGLLDDPAWERALGEQVIYLSDTGVDFFLLRHVRRLADAVTLTRRIARASDAPVLAALHVDTRGRTEDGVELARAAEALVEAGAGALGLCCGPGPAVLPAALAVLLAAGRAHGLPVAVLAGIADAADPAGTATARPYPDAPVLDPAGYAAWLAPLAGLGVAILGGCCGVTAAHTRALARALGRDAA